jgi:uncharacterized protein (DUF1330 family)
MPAYAVAHMRQVTMGQPIVEYLERIDATLAPFGGRFIVHGGDVEALEGSWPGSLIVIEFPDRDRVRAWYDSQAYREIAAPAHGQLPERRHRGRGSRRRAPGHRRAHRQRVRAGRSARLVPPEGPDGGGQQVVGDPGYVMQALSGALVAEHELFGGQMLSVPGAARGAAGQQTELGEAHLQ